MKKRITVLLGLCLLLGTAAWAVQGGSAEDPLVSLSYLTGKFTQAAEEQINAKLETSDQEILTALESGESLPVSAPAWTEVRLKQGDTLLGQTGTMVLPLAGTMRVSYSSGAVVDVTAGKEVPSEGMLTANHRYIVAEDTEAIFMVVGKTAVLDYQGEAGEIWNPDNGSVTAVQTGDKITVPAMRSLFVVA